MQFRHATFDDLDDILNIIDDGRAALASIGIDQWQGGNPTKDEICADIEAGNTMIVVSAGNERPDLERGQTIGTLAFVVGEPDYDRVLSGSWISPSPNSPTEGLVRYAALHRLAVSAKARRCGVASFMLETSCALGRALGLASLRADTHEGNLPMRTTFERFGMVNCCTIDITNPLEPTKLRLGYEIVL